MPPPPSPSQMRITRITRSSLLLFLTFLITIHSHRHQSTQFPSSPSPSSSFLLLFAHGASSFPGLPVPIDSFHTCCEILSRLPRARLTFTVGNEIYSYDPVTQWTTLLYTTREVFEPPYSRGITINNGTTFGKLDAAFTWNNGLSYWFANESVWTWHPYWMDSVAANQVDISTAWYVDGNMEGAVQASCAWTLFFKNGSVSRYDNTRDQPDHSEHWPQLTRDLYGPTFPAYISDIDIHPQRTEWLIFHGTSHTLYSPSTLTALPTYPRSIHEDVADGGINGVNRTRCSGIMDLSSMIGFIEDKSPEPFLRQMQYAPNLLCQWDIYIPASFLKAPSIGLAGIELYFDRFDLGTGAEVVIDEYMDYPSTPIADAGWNWWWKGEIGCNQRWYDQGSGDGITPNRTRGIRQIGRFNSTNQPILNQTIVRSSNQSISFRVTFRTPDASTIAASGGTGTGFAIRWGVATPKLVVHQEIDGIFWMTSLGLDPSTAVGDQSSQSIIIHPSTPSPTGVRIGMRFKMYPYTNATSSNISFTIESVLTGERIKTVDNLTTDWGEPHYVDNDFLSGSTTSEQGPIRITFIADRGFLGSMIGEYTSIHICNNDPLTPKLFEIFNGSLEDGSGEHSNYRADSDCSWLIKETVNTTIKAKELAKTMLPVMSIDGGATASSTVYSLSHVLSLNHTLLTDMNPRVLFLTFQFTSIQLSINYGGGSSKIHRIEFYDSESMDNSTGVDPALIRTITSADMSLNPLPLVVSSSSYMFIRFLTGPSYTERGWNGVWNMYYPPIPATLSITNLTKFISTDTTSADSFLKKIGSKAQALMYAGETSRQTLIVQCLDQIGSYVTWSFSQWYGVYYRWIPFDLQTSDPVLYDAISIYPYSINDPNATEWFQAIDLTLTPELQSSIFELIIDPLKNDGSLSFHTPPKSGDYIVRLVFVLHSHQREMLPNEGWGQPNMFSKNLDKNLTLPANVNLTRSYEYSIILNQYTIHVTPYIADPMKSTALKLTPALINLSLDDPILRAKMNESLNSPDSASLNIDGRGLSESIRAGDTLSFLVVARDNTGNIMEGYDSVDIRSFLVTNDMQASPPLKKERLEPGIYRLAFAPIVTALDYVLTVLISGNDLYTGPFMMEVIPGETSPAHSELFIEEVGLSLLSGTIPKTVQDESDDTTGVTSATTTASDDSSSSSSSFSSANNITTIIPTAANNYNKDVLIRIRARDAHGNLRGAYSASDVCAFKWPGHNVRFVAQGSGWNTSEWTYLVDISNIQYEVSILSATLNGVQIGYDPNSTNSYISKDGIEITIGKIVITRQSDSIFVEYILSGFSGSLMFLTLCLMIHVVYYRAYATMRVASPPFLIIMLIGALLEYGTVFPMSIPEPTKWSCALEPLLGHAGFVAIFGALLLKTRRVLSIFTAKRYSVPNISDTALMIRFAFMSIVFFSYYTLWMCLSPPEPIELIIDTSSYIVCSSRQPAFPISIIVCESVVVVYGAYLSYTIWNTPSFYNESKHLLAAIYNVAIIGGLITLLVKAILSSPSIQRIFSCIGILFVTSMVLVAIFFPKIWNLMKNRHQEDPTRATPNKPITPIGAFQLPTASPQQDTASVLADQKLFQEQQQQQQQQGSEIQLESGIVEEDSQVDRQQESAIKIVLPATNARFPGTNTGIIGGPTSAGAQPLTNQYHLVSNDALASVGDDTLQSRPEGTIRQSSAEFDQHNMHGHVSLLDQTNDSAAPIASDIM